jgi:hypothetical protein
VGNQVDDEALVMLAVEDAHRRLDDLAILPDAQFQQLAGMAAALGMLPQRHDARFDGGEQLLGRRGRVFGDEVAELTKVLEGRGRELDPQRQG